MEIKVVESSQEWPEDFHNEAKCIQEILGEELVAIHHIGSTSVVGLKAKPIIDILPVVYDITKIDAFNHEFEKLGYECMGEFGIVGRRYYRKGGNQRTHHIHLFEASNQGDINRHLAVRDYLRAYKMVADEYGELKSHLARCFPDDIDGYCDGKDAFVKKMEADALKWQAKQNQG